MGTYMVIIGRTSTGYSAHCPDVPGCATVGKTVDETVANMKQALEFHFEGMAEDRDAIPTPGGVNSYRQLMRALDVEQYLLAHVQVDTSRFATAMSQG